MCLLMCCLLLSAASGAGEPASGDPRWFAYRSFRPESETIREFAARGVGTVCFFPGNTLCSLGVPYSPGSPIWVGPDRYDFEALEAQLAEIRAGHPGAKLLCVVDLNTPDWWVRLHGRASGCSDTFYRMGETLATEVWRKHTRAFLETFLQYMCDRHEGLVEGYVLACGGTTEWQDTSYGVESLPRREAWRRWMIDRGKPDPVDIPPYSVRERTTHGLFRDPVEDGTAVDYWRFHHGLVGDSILYFARAAKETLAGRARVGVFYGYIIEHAQGRGLYEGHYDFDRVFASEEVDFFIAPGTYQDRGMGGGSGFMLPLATLRRHGKAFIHEIDHRTHTSRSVVALGVAVPGHRDGFPDEPATIAGLRREFSLALIEGVSLWWFDMFGGWFEGAPVLDAIGQMRRLWDELAPVSRRSSAEVAMIVDADSMFYVNGNAPVVPDLMYRQRIGLARAGAPYEILSFADIGEADLSRYKLALLPNLFAVDPAKKRLLEERLCRDGRTVVWVLAPGIITDDRYDEANVEALTGLPYGAEAIARRDMGQWTSVLAPRPNLDADTLRDLYRAAGVHLYSESGEPVYANDTLLASHTADGGERSFHLPRVCARITELFSGRVVAENTDRFTDTLAAPDTVLYRLD